MIRMLGRYELLEQVGSGGMAVVYRGRDTALDREVAIKLLHPHLASARDSRARFSREARAVARLSHPGIVEIFDYSGDAAVESFLVTEFVRGRTLRVFAQEVGFGFPETSMLVGRALADALVHAHSAGVIHRDLKPENVLVKQEEPPAVKLADFGIARIIASDERMTMTGALVGSPHHMAPEIIEGKDADVRSDIFSLGTILYWLATGKLPFAASNPTAILRRVLEGDLEDPRQVDPRVADPLADAIVACLALDPARRPAQAADVRDSLDHVLAQVGIDRPEEALVAFLRDPAAFREAFPARAIATLSALGDAALAEGGSARALSYFNRILAIEPDHPGVLAKLTRLTRRRRTRRLLAWSGAALALAALAAGAVALVRDASAPPLASVASPAADPPAEAPGAAAPEETPAPAPAPAEAQVATAPTPPPPPRRPGPAAPATALAVHVRPYAQRALLDGVEIAQDESVVRLSITPGKPHQLRIEHECCAPFVREITAKQAAEAGELRVPLVPRPARLRVDGDPATRVYVEGVPVGTAGDSQRSPILVRIPAGGYVGTARVRLELPGAPATDMQLELRAGEPHTVPGPLAVAPEPPGPRVRAPAEEPDAPPEAPEDGVGLRSQAPEEALQ